EKGERRARAAKNRAGEALAGQASMRARGVSAAAGLALRSRQPREVVMKKFWLLASALALLPAPASSQTMDELLNDGKNTDNVLTMSMGLSRQNYSPLNKINKGNIKRLVPVWNTSLQNEMGELAAPVVYNGVMYVIN